MPHPETAVEAVLGSDDGLRDHPLARRQRRRSGRAAAPAGRRSGRRPMTRRGRDAPARPRRAAPSPARADRRRARRDPGQARPRPERPRAGDVQRDVERALLVQELEAAAPDAADRAARGSSPARARTPASSRSATAWRSRSRSSRTTTRARSSRTRAPRPASAGILRDIFTMGARPIAVLDALRFGDPADPRTRHLVNGVVRGVGGYGNCVGVPTVGGELVFDPSLRGQPAGQRHGDRPARRAAADPGRGARARATWRSCSGRRPVATGSAARRSSPRRRSAPTSRRSGRPSRSAIRSPRSCSSRPASSSSSAASSRASRTSAPAGSPAPRPRPPTGPGPGSSSTSTRSRAASRAWRRSR